MLHLELRYSKIKTDRRLLLVLELEEGGHLLLEGHHAGLLLVPRRLRRHALGVVSAWVGGEGRGGCAALVMVMGSGMGSGDGFW